MTAKIKIPQYVIFIKSRKFDTADIKCFTVSTHPQRIVSIKRRPKIGSFLCPRDDSQGALRFAPVCLFVSFRHGIVIIIIIVFLINVQV